MSPLSTAQSTLTPTTSPVCPGLFYRVAAADGLLVRVRIPGGRLSAMQGQGLVAFAASLDSRIFQLTNRANLQLRGVQNVPDTAGLAKLQTLRLAAQKPAVDVLRNMMISPLAGLDATEVVDFSAWLPALEGFLETQPGLEQLPAKFSIGLDGGGQASIGQRSPQASEHRYHEIQLTAVQVPTPEGFTTALHLTFGVDKRIIDPDIFVPPEAGLALIKSLILAYLDYLQAPPCPPRTRLREILADWGVARFLDQAQIYCPIPLVPQPLQLSPPIQARQQYLGVHPQSQSDLAFISLGFPQGQISVAQLQALVEVASSYGTGELRLTPWHSVFLVNIPQVQIPQAITELNQYGFSIESNITQGIVACTGQPGCTAAQTDTQHHAQALAHYLHPLNLPRPVNIHLTACPKACAQPSPAEITLLGMPNQEYRLYRGDFRDNQARLLTEQPLEALLPLIRDLVTAQCSSPASPP